MMAKAAVLALAALPLLAGCAAGPVDALYRPGSTFVERRTAADQCRIGALQRIPPAMVTEVEPGYVSDGYSRCHYRNGAYVCVEHGGISYPPVVTTRDVNRGLRDRDVMNCLAAAGYAVISRPVCQSGPTMARYLAQRDDQSDPNALACVAADEAIVPDGEN